MSAGTTFLPLLTVLTPAPKTVPSFRKVLINVCWVWMSYLSLLIFPRDSTMPGPAHTDGRCAEWMNPGVSCRMRPFSLCSNQTWWKTLPGSTHLPPSLRPQPPPLCLRFCVRPWETKNSFVVLEGKALQKCKTTLTSPPPQLYLTHQVITNLGGSEESSAKFRQ